jgi:hypothetical protein
MTDNKDLDRISMAFGSRAGAIKYIIYQRHRQGVTQVQIRAALGIPNSSIHTYCEALERAGLIQKRGQLNDSLGFFPPPNGRAGADDEESHTNGSIPAQPRSDAISNSAS